MRRKDKFIEGEIYHIFNKSISNYGIFKDIKNSQRFLNIFEYYNNKSMTKCFSDFTKGKIFNYQNIIYPVENYPVENTHCKILSYCIMPDHYHFLLRILNTIAKVHFGKIVLKLLKYGQMNNFCTSAVIYILIQPLTDWLIDQRTGSFHLTRILLPTKNY